MVKVYIHIVISILIVINIFVHMIGITCLVCLPRFSMIESQRLYLLNLSLSEVCLTLMELAKRLVYITTNSEYNIISEYIKVIQFSSAAMVYYFIMIYLTADRFFVVYLHLKYPLYWSKNKTRNLLAVTWVVFIILAIVLALLYKYLSIDYNRIFYIYTWPITEAVFLVVAFGTYGYVIQKVYKRNKARNAYETLRQRSKFNNTATPSPQQYQSILKQPAFYVPTLLILTFVLLQVVPDLTVSFVIFSGRTVSENVNTAVFITYMISILLDAVIYIILLPCVKELFIKKLISLRLMKQRNNNKTIRMTNISDTDTLPSS